MLAYWSRTLIPSNSIFAGQTLKEKSCAQKNAISQNSIPENFKFLDGLQEMAVLVEMMRKTTPHCFNVKEEMQAIESQLALTNRSDVSCSLVWHYRVSRDPRSDK